jgi:hypothetical protein
VKGQATSCCLAPPSMAKSPKRGFLSPLAQGRGHRTAGKHGPHSVTEQQAQDIDNHPRCRVAPTKMPQRAAHQPHCSSIHLRKATPPTRERRQDAAVAQSDGFGFSPGKERGGGGRYTSTTPLRRGSTHRTVVVVTNRRSGVSLGQSPHPAT